jgi:hypothetical protein
MLLNRENHIFFVLVIFLVAFNSMGTANAEEDEEISSSPYFIALTEDFIKVDGVLDEAAWASALKIELKYEISPGENVPPPVRTEVLLAHNRSYLYVGFRAFDPEPDAIRAHLSDRDEIYSDDSVGILLDTFNDELRAFQFECNPLGIQRDALLNDAAGGHGHGDESWDVIWNSAGLITDWGYTVEMAIPFNALNFPRTNGEQTWGFIASRDYPRNVSYNIRSVPEDRSRNCYICQAAKMVGFESITPGRNVELNPTVTSFRYDEREDFPDGDLVKQSSATELGLTARWGITPNFNLSVAFNPDFSQVEADAYQLEINRQFTLRYQEKRPFFLEGRDFFNTPMEAVYTRSLIDPRWGVKITGKEGSNALGVYVARDEVTHLIFPASQGSDSETFNMESTAAVFRYRRDVLDNSTVGVIVTGREGGGYHNRVFGVDGRLRLTSNDSVTFQVLGADTKYDKPLFERLIAEQNDDDDDEEEGIMDIPEESLSGWAHELRYEHQTRNWDASFSHERMDEDFRVDLGHNSRVGYQRFSADFGRTWYGDGSDLINRVSVDGGYRQINELNGELLERQFESGVRVRGALQSFLSYEFTARRQNYEDLEAGLLAHSLQGSFRPFGDLDVEMNVSFGEAVDYAHAREGYRVVLGPELTLNLGRHIRINYDHQFIRFTVQGERLYLANVTQAHFIYQFNSRMFLRSIFQFIDIRRNQSLYEDEIEPISKRLFTQILFSYKLNARTVLFLGYSDNYRAYQDIDFLQSDRTFFMKIGYALVL